jgi:TolB protein
MASTGPGSPLMVLHGPGGRPGGVMMQMTKTARYGRLILGLLLLGALGAHASALTGYETRITGGTSWHTWPAISGNLVAYEDDRYGNVDIFLYNLSSGVEKRLTDQPRCDHYWPKIYGDRVVWWDNRSGFNSFDVFMYNTTTGVETRITTDPKNQENADLYRNRIVWMDRRYGNFDVFLKDTTTGSETALTNDTADQWEPQVWGDRVIWMDNRSNPGYAPDQYFDYYTYDLSTGAERALTTQGWAWYGGINGDRAVWSQWRPDGSYPGGYNEQIYLYDFSTGTERRITSDASNHWYPKVFGDRVVWEDDRNGADSNWDIWLYNATTGAEEQVTTLSSAQWNPVIWGNRIAYEDYRDGNPNIFVYTILDRPIIPVIGQARMPTDPDQDTLYEDLDGDGRKSFNDVVLFFEKMEWIAGNEPLAPFDMNGNGRIDFDDVVRVFLEL